MYGKMKDGVLYPAPGVLTLADGVHYHPSGDMYLACGYLPIVEVPVPDDDEAVYEKAYEVRGGEIVAVWHEAEAVSGEVGVPTLDERVTALEGAVLAMMGGGLDA